MEPVNFAEVIAQTDVEMQRLGWTTDQGREHLKKTYGKRSRFLLTEVELVDFLQYLASQPLDEVVTAKINVEIEELCWTQQQGQINAEIEQLCWTEEQELGHLKRNYGKRSRTLLTEVELLDFLQDIASQPAPPKITPFTPGSYSPQENITTPSGTGKRKKKAQPVDLSDVIAKTDVEMQRLGWTPEQGREHLIKTYGKRGRTLLTEEELHQFLKYLQSQPDPLAGF